MINIWIYQVKVQQLYRLYEFSLFHPDLDHHQQDHQHHHQHYQQQPENFGFH